MPLKELSLKNYYMSQLLRSRLLTAVTFRTVVLMLLCQR